jgi:hypothetical protein
MKAHRSDILGEWARENGFENIARNHHPQEVERRRQQAIKNSNAKRREYDNKGKHR